MQRDQVELGAFYHQLIGGASVSEKPVATSGAGGLRDPSGNRAERISSVRDRHALCSHRAGHDSQRHSSSRRPAILRAVFNSPVFINLVVAAGRDYCGLIAKVNRPQVLPAKPSPLADRTRAYWKRSIGARKQGSVPQYIAA